MGSTTQKTTTVTTPTREEMIHSEQMTPTGQGGRTTLALRGMRAAQDHRKLEKNSTNYQSYTHSPNVPISGGIVLTWGTTRLHATFATDLSQLPTEVTRA